MESILKHLLQWPMVGYIYTQTGQGVHGYIPLAAGLGAAYWMGAEGGGLMGYGKMYLAGGVGTIVGMEAVKLMTKAPASSK